MTPSRALPYYDEADYWMMDVDWWDLDEVLDFAAEDVLYCDFSPSMNAMPSYSESLAFGATTTGSVDDGDLAYVASTSGSFADYPWWWGANYCLEATTVTTTETVDGEDVTTTTTYTGKAWMKTDDFTGFWVIEDDDTPLTSGGDYDPAVPANWD